MRIRRPRADELDHVMIVMEYYRDEAQLPEGQYSHKAMVNTVRNYLIDPTHAWFSMYDGTRMVGVVAGYLCALPWSEQMVANVQFMYVLPSHRNLQDAHALLKEFETWCCNQGAVSITAGDIGIDVARTQAFYEHCDYAVQGITLDKALA